MTYDKEKQARTLEHIRAVIEESIRSAEKDASGAAGAPGHSRSRLLAELAHELKTPLSAIVAAAEVMRDERLGPAGNPLYQGYAADIYENANHALGVIAAMLAPSAEASRSGRDAPAFVELDLNELIRRLASSVRALLAAAGIEVETALDPALPHVIADPVTVRQLLLNLVTNAMRATPRGGRIVVRTSFTLGGPLEASVIDTGNGITPDAIDALLDPDREPATSADGRGLGIGYPLIHQLAQLNGAKVSIESASGSGTCVTICFVPERTIPV